MGEFTAKSRLDAWMFILSLLSKEEIDQLWNEYPDLMKATFEMVIHQQ